MFPRSVPEITNRPESIACVSALTRSGGSMLISLISSLWPCNIACTAGPSAATVDCPVSPRTTSVRWKKSASVVSPLNVSSTHGSLAR